MPDTLFAAPADEKSVEDGTRLTPRFDADGLVVAIAVDEATRDVLMVAYMNAEALARTIATRAAWFYSRSRQAMWRKGESSGNTLAVTEVRVDCDQDAVLLTVRVAGDGVACHTGYRSCFYRSVPLGEAPSPALVLRFDATMPRKPPHDH